MIRNRELYLMILQLSAVVLLIKTVQVQARCSGEYPCNNMNNERRNSLAVSDMRLGKQRAGLNPWIEKRARILSRQYRVESRDNTEESDEVQNRTKKDFSPWRGKREDSYANQLPLSILKERMLSSPELRSKIEELWIKRNFSPWGGK